MQICDGEAETNEIIKKYLLRVAELTLYCKISDPPFEIEIEKIGEKIEFNPLIHDPFDGFIKAKEECWVVLPGVRKTMEEKKIVTKSLVLQVDYDLIN